MMPTLIEVARQAARAAGAMLLEQYPQPRDVRLKGMRDIVTDADLAAQQIAIDLIRAHYADAAILSEEGVAPPPDARLIWAIDPIVRTTNSTRNVPIFSTSIAVARDGQPIAGVIYDPISDHLFAAELDRGATLNGAPIHVADRTDIAEAIIGLDWGRDDEVRALTLKWLNRAGSQCRTIRAFGSAALGLCYLAAGWIDVYYHASLKPWDGAAGQIIAQEAGARLSNFDGTPWTYTSATCLAYSPGLAAWALTSC